MKNLHHHLGEGWTHCRAERQFSPFALSPTCFISFSHTTQNPFVTLSDYKLERVKRNVNQDCIDMERLDVKKDLAKIQRSELTNE